MLSVVIPCHGGVEDTRACLRALLAQEQAPELEILVVDNDSRDATARLDAEFRAVRVLRQDRNLGFAGGVNAGLAAARGDWLMVLNNDAMPAPRAVRRLLDALLGDSRIGIAGPASNRVKGPASLAVGDLGASERGRTGLEACLSETCAGKLRDVETLSGLCLLFHRRLLDRVGPFDPRFGFGNFEDDDFCLRARLLGSRLVIARDAFVHHAGGRTFAAMGLDYEAELRGRERVFRDKWRGDPAGTAHLLARAGRHREAARSAALALGTHPDWPDALLYLGREAAVRRRRDEAVSHLRDYLCCCPLDTGAVALLFAQTLLLGNEPGARALLAWALRHCHFDPIELVHLLEQWSRWNLERGRNREAATALAPAFELEPERASLHNLLGVVELRAGDLGVAIPRLQRALELGSTEAYTNLGICFWHSGDPARAVAHFSAALRENPGDALARQNLERALGASRTAGGAQA